jgi:hypothetical protein
MLGAMGGDGKLGKILPLLQKRDGLSQRDILQMLMPDLAPAQAPAPQPTPPPQPEVVCTRLGEYNPYYGAPPVAPESQARAAALNPPPPEPTAAPDLAGSLLPLMQMLQGRKKNPPKPVDAVEGIRAWAQPGVVSTVDRLVKLNTIFK